MGKKEEGFDAPVIKDLDVDNVNVAINRMSEMINLLLTKLRKVTKIVEDYDQPWLRNQNHI